MAKIRAIKSMITGEVSDFQPPEASGGTSSTPVVLCWLWPANKLPANQTDQHLADKDSTEHASTDLGDQTEQPLTRPSALSSAPTVWSPEFTYKGRAVSAADLVYADKDYSLGFNMTKGLIIPADMKKHEELSDLKVLHSAAKSIVLAAQKNYLAHERMIAVRKSL
ncbi:hypothetical protein CsSME_00025226 [Camellia sinensis var. sinensis]